MAKLLNIGFGNVVNMDKVVAVVSPDAAPIKRLVQAAKESGRAVDATQGRKTKAVLVTDGDMLVLSALQPETIAKRFGVLQKMRQKGNMMAEKGILVVVSGFSGAGKGTLNERLRKNMTIMHCLFQLPPERRDRERNTEENIFSIPNRSLKN